MCIFVSYMVHAMKNTAIRYLSKCFLLTFLLVSACTSDKKDASSTAKAFLQAYYVDLNFEEALRLSSESSWQVIIDQKEISHLNPYAKEETPDIVFTTIQMESKGATKATCIYTCNRVERKLPLKKINGVWRVDLNGNTVETAGNEGHFISLQPTGSGFSSAVSGEIKYRKRRQVNK